MPPIHADQLLGERLRKGKPTELEELITRYEGRLLAFVENRIRNTTAIEDIVQETFVGVLISLPNYDINGLWHATFCRSPSKLNLSQLLFTRTTNS